MGRFEPARDPSEDRRDLHNVNVNQAVARADRCGTIYLQDGRLCYLPALHQGGCQFEPQAPLASRTDPRRR
jgi:hypothetical protein